MKPSILMLIMIFMTRYYPDSKFSLRFHSVNNHLNKILYLTFSTTTVMLLDSVEKDPSIVGTNNSDRTFFIQRCFGDNSYEIEPEFEMLLTTVKTQNIFLKAYNIS